MDSQPIDLTTIKAIVFDIGNVLVDISYDTTVQQFQELSDLDFKTILGYHQQSDFFNQYERGEISTSDFLILLKKYLRKDISDEQIIKAWNSMLVTYPAEKIELLKRLKSQFKLYALSNINELHVEELNNKVNQLFGINSFSLLFDKAIYSNEVGMRKPEPRIYNLLIKETGLSPNKILFIDDKLENIESAKQQGIQVLHLTKREMLCPLFDKAI